MKRIAILFALLLALFIFPSYVTLPLLILTALFVPYVFYELIFFGVIFDITRATEYPLYTLLSIVVVVLISFVRKRLSLHV